MSGGIFGLDGLRRAIRILFSFGSREGLDLECDALSDTSERGEGKELWNWHDREIK